LSYDVKTGKPVAVTASLCTSKFGARLKGFIKKVKFRRGAVLKLVVAKLALVTFIKTLVVFVAEIKLANLVMTVVKSVSELLVDIAILARAVTAAAVLVKIAATFEPIDIKVEDEVFVLALIEIRLVRHRPNSPSIVMISGSIREISSAITLVSDNILDTFPLISEMFVLIVLICGLIAEISPLMVAVSDLIPKVVVFMAEDVVFSVCSLESILDNSKLVVALPVPNKVIIVSNLVLFAVCKVIMVPRAVSNDVAIAASSMLMDERSAAMPRRVVSIPLTAMPNDTKSSKTTSSLLTVALV